jgi:hypothetical protein
MKIQVQDPGCLEARSHYILHKIHCRTAKSYPDIRQPDTERSQVEILQLTVLFWSDSVRYDDHSIPAQPSECPEPARPAPPARGPGAAADPAGLRAVKSDSG